MKVKLSISFFVFCLCMSDAFASSGPIWVDIKNVNIGGQSAPGRTGQWWCDNHFGGNLGGVWQCVETPLNLCASEVPNSTDVTCGRLNENGTTPFNGYFSNQESFGYGRIERTLVQQSSPGRTGHWWCDNHFGGDFGGEWKCRSVSGGNSCSNTVPNNELVSCSEYKRVLNVNIGGLNSLGRTGEWWCDNHFGGNIGGTWDCKNVTNGSCSSDAPANAIVTCGEYDEVDESPFLPVACSSSQLGGPGKEFCIHTDYMANRDNVSVYLYNDYIRAGLNRSYGATLFELYGNDKKNRIEEHGGSAVQLSIWGYDILATGAGFFTNSYCNSIPYSNSDICKQDNNGKDCSIFPETGRQISNCNTELACGDWSAGAPINPIQAQAVNCGWNGDSNDIDAIEENNGVVTLTDNNPFNFTKTTALNGLTWKVSGTVPNDRPYIRLYYQVIFQSSEYNLTTHNQEIPALFTKEWINYWYYFYSGNTPYSNSESSVTRLRSDFGTQTSPPSKSALLKLLNRASPQPQPEPDSYYFANEEWLTVCTRYEDQCLTIASFSPEIKAFSLAGSYITPLGRFELGGGYNNSWEIYLFPYRFDDVVAGKSVRQWIFDLKNEN